MKNTFFFNTSVITFLTFVCNSYTQDEFLNIKKVNHHESYSFWVRNKEQETEAATRDQRYSIKKVDLENSKILTGKHLCWSLFLIKLQTFRSVTLLKKDPSQVFSCEFCRNFKNIHFEEHLRTVASGKKVIEFCAAVTQQSRRTGK